MIVPWLNHKERSPGPLARPATSGSVVRLNESRIADRFAAFAPSCWVGGRPARSWSILSVGSHDEWVSETPRSTKPLSAIAVRVLVSKYRYFAADSAGVVRR
jgi:hypothetical protein